MIEKLKRLIGWCGTGFVIGGYMLLSLGIIGNDWRYHACMLIGSTCLAWIAYRARLWELVTLNTCFVLFAIIGLLRPLLWAS